MQPTAAAGVLMEQAAAAPEDFDAVVEIYWARVFRFAVASLRDRDAAEALTQDCFLHACKAWAHFRGEASIQTWLMRIAVNLVRDAARNRRLQFWRRARLSNPEEMLVSLRDGRLSPEGQALLREQIATVWNATTLLPERQRTVFLLRFAEEMTLLEIAAATNLTENAVKVHLYRALRTVRERLGKS